MRQIPPRKKGQRLCALLLGVFCLFPVSFSLEALAQDPNQGDINEGRGGDDDPYIGGGPVTTASSTTTSVEDPGASADPNREATFSDLTKAKGDLNNVCRKGWYSPQPGNWETDNDKHRGDQNLRWPKWATNEELMKRSFTTPSQLLNACQDSDDDKWGACENKSMWEDKHHAGPGKSWILKMSSSKVDCLPVMSSSNREFLCPEFPNEFDITIDCKDDTYVNQIATLANQRQQLISKVQDLKAQMNTELKAGRGSQRYYAELQTMLAYNYAYQSQIYATAMGYYHKLREYADDQDDGFLGFGIKKGCEKQDKYNYEVLTQCMGIQAWKQYNMALNYLAHRNIICDAVECGELKYGTCISGLPPGMDPDGPQNCLDKESCDAEYCKDHPESLECACQGGLETDSCKTACSNNPNSPYCHCGVNYNLGGKSKCEAYCKESPNEKVCACLNPETRNASFCGGSTKNPCVDNPTSSECKTFCDSNPTSSDCCHLNVSGCDNTEVDCSKAGSKCDEVCSANPSCCDNGVPNCMRCPGSCHDVCQAVPLACVEDPSDPTNPSDPSETASNTGSSSVGGTWANVGVPTLSEEEKGCYVPSNTSIDRGDGSDVENVSLGNGAIDSNGTSGSEGASPGGGGFTPPVASQSSEGSALKVNSTSDGTITEVSLFGDSGGGGGSGSGSGSGSGRSGGGNSLGQFLGGMFGKTSEATGGGEGQVHLSQRGPASSGHQNLSGQGDDLFQIVSHRYVRSLDRLRPPSQSQGYSPSGRSSGSHSAY